MLRVYWNQRKQSIQKRTCLFLQFLEQADISWLSAMDKPETFLAKRKWVATVVQPGEESAHFGRWPYPVIPRSVPNIPRTWFVTARQL